VEHPYIGGQKRAYYREIPGPPKHSTVWIEARAPPLIVWWSIISSLKHR